LKEILSSSSSRRIPEQVKEQECIKKGVTSTNWMEKMASQCESAWG